MREIELTKGQVALVDDDDFERLGAHKWFAHWSNTTQSFYACRNVRREPGAKQTTLQMHREIMGASPGEDVDHIHRDTLDNRRSELRLCSRSENRSNSGLQRNSTSGFKGVSFFKRTKLWASYIKAKGRRIHLGFHSTAKEAAEAYDSAAKRIHGEFAVTNRELGLL